MCVVLSLSLVDFIEWLILLITLFFFASVRNEETKNRVKLMVYILPKRPCNQSMVVFHLEIIIKIKGQMAAGQWPSRKSIHQSKFQHEYFGVVRKSDFVFYWKRVFSSLFLAHKPMVDWIKPWKYCMHLKWMPLVESVVVDVRICVCICFFYS